ncbi:GntR family transcriptional regulator [Ruania alba]|uniref:DNA-binding transcriptional regulator, GntR family n=1 Tax=Ruania alba TaxID=648782 RepID=A0A1H5H6X4_9MICO|nr:GntR family transcriptional regulator [Ruania alba]SEE23737.1 DNA-binding transcriptional regulator, GntR family [Ruania alba]
MVGRFALTPSSLTDALYESLRLRIINSDLPAGEKLTEARVAADYDVARPTAKACLERLTAAGLLRRSAHKTAVVPTFTVDELEDLFIAREAVERAAVVRLAAVQEVPKGAVDAQGAIEVAAEQLNFPDQVAADIEFHMALVEAAGSSRLAKMHSLIMGEVHLTMGQFQAHRSTSPGDVASEHAAIMQAITDGDAATAAATLLAHLAHARDRLTAQALATGR